MLPGEGVVLKKGKNNYTCCPPQLRDIPYGLYDMAMELNVRVRIHLFYTTYRINTADML